MDEILAVNPEKRKKEVPMFNFCHLSHLFGLLLQTNVDVIFFHECGGLDFLKKVFNIEMNLKKGEMKQEQLLIVICRFWP